MLAQRLPTILPPLTEKEAIEIAVLHSASGKEINTHTLSTRPFRSPHHSASYSAVIGGGSTLTPGEISLAHNGVLFLDEFPEFDRRVIESLREPLEEHAVTITRSKSSHTFPARMLFIAAMNPCPCGYKGSKTQHCTCTAVDIQRYKKKLSGPILDRIDMIVSVGEMSYSELRLDQRMGKSSGECREIVQQSRERMYTRAKEYGVQKKENGLLSNKELDHVLLITKEAVEVLEKSARRLGFSARAFHRIQKVARTIADIDGSEQVEVTHILESLAYRNTLL
jgi:magnesium chelatase family protein